MRIEWQADIRRRSIVSDCVRNDSADSVRSRAGIAERQGFSLLAIICKPECAYGVLSRLCAHAARCTERRERVARWAVSSNWTSFSRIRWQCVPSGTRCVFTASSNASAQRFSTTYQSNVSAQCIGTAYRPECIGTRRIRIASTSEVLRCFLFEKMFKFLIKAVRWKNEKIFMKTSYRHLPLNIILLLLDNFVSFSISVLSSHAERLSVAPFQPRELPLEEFCTETSRTVFSTRKFVQLLSGRRAAWLTTIKNKRKNLVSICRIRLASNSVSDLNFRRSMMSRHWRRSLLTRWIWLR